MVEGYPPLRSLLRCPAEFPVRPLAGEVAENGLGRVDSFFQEI
jgi:hypothetical protein